MVEAPKKRAGRPKKNAFDKPEQFSIRLPFLPKLVLEAIARHRGISLSQAVEYAITDVGSRYKIGGTPIVESVTEAMRAMATDAPEGSPLAENRNNFIAMTERINQSTQRLSNSELGRVLLLPDEVLSPEERFFIDVIRHPSFPSEISITYADTLLDAVRRLYKSGWKVAEVVEVIKEQHEKNKQQDSDDVTQSK